jgi:hypothetical protein
MRTLGELAVIEKSRTAIALNFTGAVRADDLCLICRSITTQNLLSSLGALLEGSARLRMATTLPR